MVRFNDIEFQVYDLDTKQSIMNRQAGVMNTLSSYLFFPDGIPDIQKLRQDINIVVEDLFSIIAGYNGEFSYLYKQIKDKLIDQHLNLRVDILNPYIAYNIMLEGVPEDFRGAVLLQIETDIIKTKLFEGRLEIESIWENREDIKNSRRLVVNNNKKQVELQLQLFSQFENIINGIPYTDFQLEKVKFNLVLDLKDISLLEIFNNVKLDTTVPFATVSNFYKILKDFIPPSDWSISVDDGIIFKVLEKVNTTNIKFSDFTDALVLIEGELGNEIVRASLDLSTSGNNLSREDFIQRFLNILSGLGQVKVKSVEENQVNGVFYFPNHSLNKYVLSDLIMNNPLFSSMMSVDESDKASKKKPSIYVHFNHPMLGHVTANITEKIMEKNDISMRGKNKNLFPLNERYIRVKVSKADNIEAVNKFQSLLSRLFVVYGNELNTMIAFYRKFIPTFGDIEPIPVIPVKKVVLKDVAPEIFLPNYSRKCLNRPTIIGDEAVAEAEAEGKQVMVFPNLGEASQPRNYICEHPDHPFPGLRDNPLANADEFPYIPCCYAKNQELRQGSRYRHYYYGEDLPGKGLSQQDLYTTNKFVPNNIFGTLPQNINKMFEVTDLEETYVYVRKGVFRNKSSFLNCILEAMNDDTNILNIDDEDERESKLIEIRKELATEALAAACRQEMYDFTISEIMEAIKNPDVYLDPKLFIHLLELKYNCEIFLFTRNTINGEMTLPRHLQTYYKMKQETKCIFIFEHIGSEADHADYPQCELIVRWKVGDVDDVTYNFEPTLPMVVNVKEVYYQLRTSYALNVRIPDTEFPWISDAIIKSQRCDSYGKTRTLNIIYDNQPMTLLTNPIQPVNIIETNSNIVMKIDVPRAIAFASEAGMIVSKQVTVGGIVKELSGFIGNVIISIPVEDYEPIEGIPEFEGGLNYSENYISVVDQYNQNKKLARYIVEYIYWLYSRFLNEEGIDNMTTESMLEFERKYIRVDKDFIYGNVPKTFSMNSGLMSGNRLIVKSEETLKRLFYVLRLAAVRYGSKILKYHTRNVIEGYYIDITDFDQYSFQVVLEGDQSVSNWIQERKIIHNIRNEVVSILMPYFFQNDLVGTQIYLAQNVDSHLKAIAISEIWNRLGYNPGEEVKDAEPVEFTLYSYVNPKTIEKYLVAGPESSFEIQMLGYKINGETMFTVLLPL